jgi:uncharacterized membrane protein YhaH (DUF805 family)
MIPLLERYFSFRGRLARLPFFIRTLYLNIAASLMLAASAPLLWSGGRIGWWAGLCGAAASLAVLAAGLVSLIVRRLHDLGFAGYHLIWAFAAEIAWTALSASGPRFVLDALPLLAIDLWLTFWPGNAGANRFGGAPD